MAQYGILSEQEADTITLWRVKDFHGTSLYPRAPSRQTSGLAFVIPPGLKKLDSVGPPDFTLEEIRATPRPKVAFSKQQNKGKKMAEHVNREGVEASDLESDSDEGDNYADVVQEIHGNQDDLPPRVQWLMDEMADRADEEMDDDDDDQPEKGKKRSTFDPAESVDEDSGDGRSKRRKVEPTDVKPTPGKTARRGGRRG